MERDGLTDLGEVVADFASALQTLVSKRTFMG
jgi:hypothetical protein